MTLVVLNPATEQPIAELERAGVEETDAAVARAKAAFPAWRAVAPADRARLLRRLATLVEEHGEELARIESHNVGKPIAGARGEVGMVAQVFHFYAGAVDKHYGETIPVAGGVDIDLPRAARRRRPDRPVELPAQHRLLEARPGARLRQHRRAEAGRADAALGAAARASSCSRRASRRASSTSLVGQGSVVGQRLVEHPDVAKIGFTGSTEVGRSVMQGAAGTIKRVTLELGGKSANVVFADADLERAAAAAPYAVFDNAGQDCCARSRILVERSAYDRFVELLVEATRERQGRRPRATTTTEMGPLISAAASRDGRLVRRGRAALPRRRRRRARATGIPCTVVEAANDDRDRARGGLRPGRGADPVRRRGRRDPDRERHAVRPLGLDLDARRRARAARRARARDGRALASTRTARCASRRRSAASSSPASAASSGCTRSTATRRSRTSSISTEG